jgi:integrase/recombinase XerD
MDSDDPTFEELTAHFVRYQESRNLSYNTLRVYDQVFRQFMRFADQEGLTVTASSMTSDLFRRFHAWLKATPTERARFGGHERSPGGIANRIRCLRALVKFCQEEELIAHKVTIKEPAVPRPLFPVFSDAELSSIFASRWCKGSAEQAVRNRSLLTLMLDSGLRVGEIGTLEVDDLLLEDRLVRVTGKGRKARYVPFSQHTAQELGNWLASRGRQPGSVFELAVSSIQSRCRKMGQDLPRGLRQLDETVEGGASKARHRQAS